MNTINAGSKKQTRATYDSVMEKAICDPTFKLNIQNAYTGKDEEVCPYEIFWGAYKRIAAELGYPNKNEIDDAVTEAKISKQARAELGQLCPLISMMQMMSGESFELPALENFRGSIYLKAIPEGEKAHPNRDIKTGEVKGTVVSHWKPHFKLAVKSKPPKALITKTASV